MRVEVEFVSLNIWIDLQPFERMQCALMNILYIISVNKQQQQQYTLSEKQPVWCAVAVAVAVATVVTADVAGA